MDRKNKDTIKNNLTIQQVENLVAELGGEPMLRGNNILICKTICHGGQSHKLYYYDNTKLFQCYTDCTGSFDIYQLVLKVKKIAGEKIIINDSETRDYELPDAIIYVANFFGIQLSNEEFLKGFEKLQDWEIFYKWEANKLKKSNSHIVNLPIYDDSFLKNLPTPRILPWEREGISQEIMKLHKICYDPKTQSIVIPHYNINNKLIGIRERTLVKEEEIYGKYKPAIFNNIMFNHPISFNLYNINWSKANIQNFKKVIVYESEKSTLQYSSYFSIENDISVAVCGSNLVNYQVSLLLSLGVEEIIIAFDRQYKEVGDDEYKKWVKKFQDIHNKYGKYVQISYILDKKHLLDYKDSPIDKGGEVFLKLFQERIIL